MDSTIVRKLMMFGGMILVRVMSTMIYTTQHRVRRAPYRAQWAPEVAWLLLMTVGIKKFDDYVGIMVAAVEAHKIAQYLENTWCIFLKTEALFVCAAAEFLNTGSAYIQQIPNATESPNDTILHFQNPNCFVKS